MSHAIKTSDALYREAQQYSVIDNRSVTKQIEYWSKIGKIAEANPNLSYNLIRELLLAKEELETGEISEYKFGQE